jgi:hypothetical protein
MFAAACDAGRFFNLNTEQCEDCGYGFFQPTVGSFSCMPCGVGKTTLTTTSTSEDECRDECSDGEHLIQAGTCQRCPQGAYRTKGVHKTCIPCPTGTTTERDGAVRRNDCNTPRCGLGQFLVQETKQCQFCKSNIVFVLFIVSIRFKVHVVHIRMNRCRQAVNYAPKIRRRPQWVCMLE